MSRPAEVLTLRDCPLDPLDGWTVAVVGYGNQGTAQAQNLRDSGLDVFVAVDSGRPSAARARADGFAVHGLDEITTRADLIALLAPDEEHANLVARILASGAPPGPRRLRAWVLAHGFSLVYEHLPIPEGDDVFVVAPAGPGVQVRSRFLEGRGVPALLAVHRDPSGQAEPRARAYAAAIGAARAGLLRSSVRDEVEVDLFGEQAVLCGGMTALTGAAFDTLVEAGYAPEAAYLECVHQLRLTAELVELYGVEGMRRRISSTALFGDLSRGPRVGAGLATALSEILAEVRSGRFAREWSQARGEEPAWREAWLRRVRNEELERAGAVIRGLFSAREKD